jgi:hypothetical protein
MDFGLDDDVSSLRAWIGSLPKPIGIMAAIVTPNMGKMGMEKYTFNDFEGTLWSFSVRSRGICIR